MEERKWYVFTFGYGQKHEGRFVRIFGTYAEARQEMIDRFGIEWAFQYSQEEWDAWEKRRPSYVPAETELL